jgi:hypothetical protein
MGDTYFDVGSGLAVPGLEGVFEYGDASMVERDRIPGAMLMNDRSRQEWVRFRTIDGIQGDPEGRDSRQVKSDQDGEDAGLMRYAGRTIGLTGEVEAGSIPAVRDLSTRFFSQFGKRERDLLIHPPRELPIRTNMIANPGAQGAQGAPELAWYVGTTATYSGSSDFIEGGTDGLTAGQGYVLGLTGPGRMSVWSDDLKSAAPWDGEDVFVAVRAQVGQDASGGTSSLKLRMKMIQSESEFNDSGWAGTTVDTTISSPTIAAWYWLTMRVPAASIARSTRYVALDVTMTWTTSTGDAVLNIQDAMLVLLDASDPSPTAFFGAPVPGYEHQGQELASSSSGPLYAVNMVVDPKARSAQSVTDWWHSPATTGVTVTQAPARDPRLRSRLSDDGVGVYAKLTKDNNSTSRTMMFGPRGPIGTSRLFRVHQGRSYRWSSTVSLIQKPAAGSVQLAVVWYDYAGLVISTSATTIGAVGTSDVEIQAAAPAAAVACRACLQAATTTALGVLEASIVDACLMDVTDVDVDQFVGSGVYEIEASPPGSLARRWIPRPFLIQRVRKASEAKAAEQQQDGRYKRDFTMGLRASDPRIYVLDERRAQIKMSGTPEFVAVQAPADFTLDTAGLPVPSGFTYEGHYITHPGTGTAYKWGREITNGPAGSRPNGGVGVRAYDAGAPVSDPNHGYGSTSNQPAQDIKTRMYRSSEGFTYQTPRVILGCAPGSDWPARSSNQRAMQWGKFPVSSINYDTATVLLKRVASGTWLELRWNSVSHADLVALGLSGLTDACYAFELWCSHNTSGSAAVTKLASWDYSSYDSSSSLYPFDYVTDSTWLTSWMVGNVVYWELWKTYPSQVDFSERIEAGSYAIPSGLQSVIGTGVAGHCGWSTRIDQGKSPDIISWMEQSWTPPYVHYYEQSDATLVPQVATMPVIGSIETPQVIQLRGGLTDPIVSVTVPEFDGEPQKTSVARFTGTIADADPIYVDLSANGSVRDGFGQNRRDLLIPGSRFEMLRPGLNQISLQAKSWGAYPAHLITSWRDALASG